MKDTFWVLLACLVIAIVAIYCGAWSFSHFLGKLVHN